MGEEKPLSIDDVINACSRAKLSNNTLSFDSYGTSEVRFDTINFLDSKGYTLEDGEKIINSLKKEDLDKGPVDNKDPTRQKHKLWIFKKYYEGLKLYIKLLVYKNGRCVAVVSLHDDR